MSEASGDVLYPRTTNRGMNFKIKFQTVRNNCNRLARFFPYKHTYHSVVQKFSNDSRRPFLTASRAWFFSKPNFWCGLPIPFTLTNSTDKKCSDCRSVPSSKQESTKPSKRYDRKPTAHKFYNSALYKSTFENFKSKTSINNVTREKNT